MSAHHPTTLQSNMALEQLQINKCVSNTQNNATKSSFKYVIQITLFVDKHLRQENIHERIIY